MERISILIYRHIIGALTPEEKAELDEWTARSRENEKFVKRVTSPDELQRWRERRNVITLSVRHMICVCVLIALWQMTVATGCAASLHLI
ncbi:hypothetical protein [uncultured Duncaniella sp.]|uniref:hypothetical protein n=1 Tax=uncultured Duncaniella sp. TaxID=2768039 RepID=UPI0025B1B0A6|nr:hypothetical protein [uncultured Duncaniella sp.]